MPSQCVTYHNTWMVNQTIKNFIDFETETLMGTCSWNISQLNKYVWNKLSTQIRSEITGTTNSAGCLCLTVLIVLGKKIAGQYLWERPLKIFLTRGRQKNIMKCKPNLLFRKSIRCCWFRGQVHTKVLESFCFYDSNKKKIKEIQTQY